MGGKVDICTILGTSSTSRHHIPQQQHVIKELRFCRLEAHETIHALDVSTQKLRSNHSSSSRVTQLHKSNQVVAITAARHSNDTKYRNSFFVYITVLTSGTVKSSVVVKVEMLKEKKVSENSSQALTHKIEQAATPFQRWLKTKVYNSLVLTPLKPLNKSNTDILYTVSQTQIKFVF